MIGLKMKNLLLLSLVALTLADSDETNSIATRDPKLILNPFALFGSPQCEVTGTGETGICYGELECLSLAGTYGQFCGGVMGLCCVFNRHCNMRTSQEVSYFKNPRYPVENFNLPSCKFTVIKRSDKFCSLRIEAPPSQLPQNDQNCGFTFLTIVAGAREDQYTFCKNTALSQIIDMRQVQKVFLTVHSTTPIQASFKVKVTQVLCSDATGGTTGTGGKPIVLPPFPVTAPPAVIAPVHTTPRPTTQRPTTHRPTPRPTPPPVVIAPVVTPSPPSPPAPPTNNPQCGRKGPSRRGEEESPNRRQILAKDNPFLSDLEFPRSHTNESLFHFWAGVPSLLDVRVTHGKTTGLWEYPWQIAMFIGTRYHCGGSIIDNQHILTAAHCVDKYKRNPRNIKLSLGDWDLSNQDDASYVEALVQKVHVHERYSRLVLQNDIAILKLTKPITFNERIKPVCLPNPGLRTDGILATVTGWGRDERRKLKSKLQMHQSTVLPNTVCSAQWVAKKAPANFIVPTMLCMDASKGDSCNGDSGGPLVHQQGSSWVQVGLVSFGSGSCTDANLAGVYTRVSEYVDWIRGITG